MLTVVDLDGVTFAAGAEELDSGDGDGDGEGSEVGGVGGAGEVAMDGVAPGALGRLKGPSALPARTITRCCFTLPLNPTRFKFGNDSDGIAPPN